MTTMTLHERIASLTPAARRRLAARLGISEGGARDASRPSGAPATLVAYYVSTSGREIAADALREFLGASLPPHLIPSRFCRIGSVPRTLHGKVDLAALPSPSLSATPVAPVTDAAPTAIEAELLAIWTSVLGIKRIARSDSFFELGGDSLLAIRLLGQIRDRWNIDLSMAELFDSPTVAGAATQIESVLWARNSGGSGTVEGGEDREEVVF